MTTQLSGQLSAKVKRQAGLGNIDSRFAEIRDILAGIFPASPDKFIVVIFLLLYLEVLYGCLECLPNGSELETKNTTLFNQFAQAIKAQFFVNKFPKLLELDDTKDGELIADFNEAITSLSTPAKKDEIDERQKLIKGEGHAQKNHTEGLEEKILKILTPLTPPFTPAIKLIAGTFFLIYLEVLYGFSSGESKNNFNAVASAIQQEYCYSFHDILLHDDVKDKFEAAFQNLTTDSEFDSRKKLIKEVETEIFYRLNPLIPF